MANNTIHPISKLSAKMADTPAISEIVFLPDGAANLTISSTINPSPTWRHTVALWTIGGSWPRAGQPGTTAVPLKYLDVQPWRLFGMFVVVPRTGRRREHTHTHPGATPCHVARWQLTH
jgi:hypothetical protein